MYFVWYTIFETRSCCGRGVRWETKPGYTFLVHADGLCLYCLHHMHRRESKATLHWTATLVYTKVMHTIHRAEGISYQSTQSALTK